MRLPAGIAAAEVARIADALQGAEDAIAGVLAVVPMASGWADKGPSAALTSEVAGVEDVGGCEGAYERNLRITVQIVASYNDRGVTGKDRFAAQARAIYAPWVAEAVTPSEMVEVGATLKIEGHRVYTDQTRQQTIITFDAQIQIVVRVADLAEE